jgi:transcriptional regulator with XRE-family HTH domain
MKPRERFAINLRKARKAKGISQEELGFRCDLHRTEISLLERGGREPRLGTIVKLAALRRRHLAARQEQIPDQEVAALGDIPTRVPLNFFGGSSVG